MWNVFFNNRFKEIAKEMEEELTKFNEWFTANYNERKKAIQTYCFNSNCTWSLDLFHDTYLNICSSISNGMKIDYSNINNYFFVAYKNTVIGNERLAWNRCRDANYNDANIHQLLQEQYTDDEEMNERENTFIENFKWLIRLEHDIKLSLSEEYARIFTNKMNGKPLDIEKGERGKWEFIKKWIRENEYWQNKFII